MNLLRNATSENMAEKPRQLTEDERLAVETRRPIRINAYRALHRAAELSFPELFNPATAAHAVVVDLAAHRAQQAFRSSVSQNPADYALRIAEPTSHLDQARQMVADAVAPVTEIASNAEEAA
jgi:hypothetical protein